MKKAILIALAALALASCSDEERAGQRLRIQQELPAGCEIRDLGSYANVPRVVAVICDGRSASATHTTWTEMAGKTAVSRSTLTIVIGEPS